jgi:hypothetical protein
MRFHKALFVVVLVVAIGARAEAAPKGGSKKPPPPPPPQPQATTLDAHNAYDLWRVNYGFTWEDPYCGLICPTLQLPLVGIEYSYTVLSATLTTATGSPVVGAKLTATLPDGRFLCEMWSGYQAGTYECYMDDLQSNEVRLAGGYRVRFDGTSEYLPSQDDAAWDGHVEGCYHDDPDYRVRECSDLIVL